jgi:1,4-dihydroxy-6-naphthoate synthase
MLLLPYPVKTRLHIYFFHLAFPNAKNKVFVRYDEVENFVAAGKGLGVIIHENRFTYAAKGLHKIIDLGDYWEKETANPIPLGGIVIKRKIDAGTAAKSRQADQKKYRICF